MEEKQTIITFDDVSMRFNLATEKVDSLKEYIIRAVKKQLQYDEFWALNHISFSVKKSEAVGLIGLNGSGKSTILKLVARVLKPTRGTVTVNGSVAPLIELGAGFDLDLTGRENIYLNGAMLGHSRADMNEVYQDIVTFSELEAFMDVPVKNYSSGMLSRLAFSIATSGKSDILIVDEVLAVGDHRFQEKCQERIRQKMEEQTTVLFVSHDIEQVKEVCDRVIWIEQGQIRMQGPTQEICAVYEKEH